MIETVIHKYGPLGFDLTEIEGRPTHVGVQSGQIYVWTIKNYKGENTKRNVRLYATGEPFDGLVVGSVVTPHELVWHVIQETA